MNFYELFESLVSHDMPRSEKYSSDRTDFEVQPQLGELIDRIEAGEIEPKIVNINPQKLQATQGWLDTRNGGGAPLLDRYTKLPVILKDQSGYHILDGHHRTSHALSKGQQSIKVYLFRMPDDLTEASFADLKKRIPSFLVDEWHEGTGIPKKVLYLYGELGQDQRARPEQIMVQLQPYVSGVLDFCIEHVGDLSNRATPNHGLNWSWGSVKEKAEKTYRTLTHSYGFEREFEENLAANAQYRGLDLAEYKKKVDAGLKQYAAAHAELLKNAHCPLHKNCVRAAVALGKKDFAGAATFLENILALVKTKESYVNALRDYEPKLNQTLAGEEVLDEDSAWDKIKNTVQQSWQNVQTAKAATPAWQAAIDSKDVKTIEQGISDLADNLGVDKTDPGYKQWAGKMRYKAYKQAGIQKDVTDQAELTAYGPKFNTIEVPGVKDDEWIKFGKDRPPPFPSRIKLPLDEEALERFEIGMGLEQMHNNDIALVGGMRSGSSPAGLTRLRYSIYDVPMLKQLKQDGGDQNDALMGYVELMVEDGSGNIAGLINIEMKRGSKRAGYGTQVIRSIMDSPFAQKPFRIYDIELKAVGFWKKMGVEFTRSDFKTPTEPTKLNAGHIFGIIR
jgi:hypothetical protein